MSKHYQESEIEFRKTSDDNSDYPETRGLVVYQYGGTIEECIAKARKEFNLDDEWEVVSTEKARL
jgi:hypothetical protein